MSAPTALRRAAAGSAAVVAAALLTPAVALAAPKPVPCTDSGGGHHTCTFYKAGDGHSGGAPVRNARDRVVGFLHKGSNWVICQQQGRRATHGRYYNNNWGWTLADDGKWGWVNALWASGGSNNGAFGGTPACYGAHGNPPGVSYPVRPPAHRKHRRTRQSCPRYAIFGVRGSGEAYAGPHNMGTTVGVVADDAISRLPAHSTVASSIPYPAAGAGTLISDPNRFFQSMDDGKYLLVGAVHKLAARCGRTRIAIIGYSQGAGVASEAVRMMSRADKARIAALVLFADTFSNGNTRYARTFNPSTQDQRGWKRDGKGIFGGKPIPMRASKIADVCFNVDPVCVSGGATTLVNAFFASVHTVYKSWDGNGIAPSYLPLLFGGFVSLKLEGR